MKVLTKLYLSFILIFILLASGVYSQDKNQSGSDNDFSANKYCNEARDLFFAQLDEGPPFDMPFPPDEEFFKSRRKHLEQLRILKLLELLDLNEDQDIEFIRFYRKHRRDIKQIDKEHQNRLKKLSDGLRNKNISEKAIFRLSTEILDISDERFKLHRSFLNEARQILSPEQFGKLIVFQERFERELLEQVRQFRNQERFGPRQGRRGMGNEKQKTFDLN